MEKLTFVKRTDTDAKGDALMSKQGKPYTRVSIKTESKGDHYISGFGNQGNADWKVGDEVDIVITESDAKDKTGKPYLNFSQAKKEDKVYDNTETILNKLVGIDLTLNQILAAVKPQKKTGIDYPVNDVPEPFPEDEAPF